MKLKRNCIFFNAKTQDVGGTPDWEHFLGQGHPLYLLKEPGCSEIINGMVYNNVDVEKFSYGNGGENYQTEIVSIFKKIKLKIFDSETKEIYYAILNNPLILILVKQIGGTHSGRRLLKLSQGFTYNDINNKDFYSEINTLITNPWFGYELIYDNVNTGELLMTIIKAPISYPLAETPDVRYISKASRKEIWSNIVDDYTNLFPTYEHVERTPQDINSNHDKGYNKIYFGPPGTGKSHEIKEYLKDNNIDSKHYSRVTFHPDYDYTSFVGGYKPRTDENDGGKIKYQFVPQVFIEMYIKAWSNRNEHFCLVIEEINRGNCAEIFGDIFQLLDRNPEYNIEPSNELRRYLEEQEKDISEKEGKEVKLLFDDKLQMPETLSILASMNTSDQSLFPMDSAFKRRWDWKYVSINPNCPKSNFNIEMPGNQSYSWLAFIKKVNERIYSVTRSSDKQIGNWFIDATKNNNIISTELFINKVLFYLWNDIFKDEAHHPESIFKFMEGDREKEISFNDFYDNDQNEEYLKYLFQTTLKIQPLPKIDDNNIVDERDNVTTKVAVAKEEI